MHSMRGGENERLFTSLYSVSYFFSQGSSFADVTEMTDIFEGTIIMAARRLVGFLNQVTTWFHFGWLNFLVISSCKMQIHPSMNIKWKRAGVRC